MYKLKMKLENLEARLFRISRRITKGMLNGTNFAKYLKRPDYTVLFSRKRQLEEEWIGTPHYSIGYFKNDVMHVQYNSLKHVINYYYKPRKFGLRKNKLNMKAFCIKDEGVCFPHREK